MNKAITASLCAVLLLAPTVLLAQSFDFHFVPSTVSGSPGDTVTFTATLKNIDTVDQTFNGDNPGDPGLGFVLDDSKFYTNFVGGPPGTSRTLAPGESITGEILDVLIGASVSPGDYAGLFEILNGGSTVAQDVYDVHVQSSAPLPPAALIFLFGGAAALLSARRRNPAERRASNLA